MVKKTVEQEILRRLDVIEYKLDKVLEIIKEWDTDTIDGLKWETTKNIR